MTRPRLNVKIGLACGLLSPLVFAVLYVIAISQDPNYAFYENYLSDLGVGPGAWAFNSGVMIAGTLAVVFAQLGLRKVFGRGVLYALSTGLLSLGGLFLFFIGVFTEDAGDVHLLFSIAFFLTMLVALGALSGAFQKSNVLGRFCTGVTLIAFLFGLALLPFGANPQTETLAVLAILAWSVAIASALLIRELRPAATIRTAPSA